MSLFGAPIEGRRVLAAKKSKGRPGACGPLSRADRARKRAQSEPPAPASANEPIPTAQYANFPVVGIGASAGGLDALMRFFDALPAETGMAFVLVQHLEPTHESLTAELLGRHTTMAVAQVRDRVRVEPNHVYVIPPDRDLAIRDGTLHLTGPAERRGMRYPIDFFLRSLAEERQEKAIVVILSGTGTDGALGVKAVKGSGGMAMAQDPASAQYDGMPRSAIATGLVDYVLPVEQLPEALVSYARHPYVNGAAPASPTAQPSAGERDPLIDVLAVLRARTRYDFRRYKKSMLARRVQRRMGLIHIEAVSDYLAQLRHNPDEVRLLFKDLLIGVTGFFREPEAYQVLEEQVLPKLVETKEPDGVVRVWVPGCATGEEPYSLAILLCEQLARVQKTCPIQMFASDINEEALHSARAGIYPETIAADVSAERLRRYFLKEGPTYQVSKLLRDTVVFALQNVISDPPFSRLDLTSCRNLLIYLEPDLQKKLIALFHFALNPGGYLFLGNSETTGRAENLFAVVSKKWRIYRRIGSGRLVDVEFPFVAGPGRIQELGATTERPTLAPRDVAQLAQRVLLDTCVPAAVLINRKYQILYFQGDSGRYLNPPVGEPTQDLLSLIREGLRSKLRAAVHKAVEEGQRVTVTGGRVQRNGGWSAVRIGAVPVPKEHEREGLLLVTFEDEPEAEPAAREEGVSADEAALRQLELELKATREDLQSTIEELETSNEELKASNEEVMSMNEELQSTNEELETSKEELQSLNEELITLNNQLQEKLTELEATNNDLANLLNSTDIATVFLDASFRIKRFTPATRGLLNLIPSDVGRPMSDIACKFHVDDLLRDAAQVLDRLTPIETQRQTDDGQWFIRRVLPYRTQDNRIDGVVVTFVDVTDRTRAAEALKTLNETLEQRVAERTAAATLLRDVASAANRAHTLEEALGLVLKRVAAHAGACFFDAFIPAEENADEFTPICVGTPAPERFGAFTRITRQVRPHRREGLTGRVYATGRYVWAPDLATVLCPARAPTGAEVGLVSGAAFPVMCNEQAVASIELFWDRTTQPEQRLIETMGSITTQLGRVVERSRGEQRVRVAE